MKNRRILRTITAFLGVYQTHDCREWKNKCMEFKLFLLCKNKSNLKDGVSFIIQMAQVPFFRSWRKEHLIHTATTYMHLKIDDTKTLCIPDVSCTVNTTLMVYAMSKTKRVPVPSAITKGFVWTECTWKGEGQKHNWNRAILFPPTLIQLKEYQFPAEILRQSKMDPSVRLDFLQIQYVRRNIFPNILFV